MLETNTALKTLNLSGKDIKEKDQRSKTVIRMKVFLNPNRLVQSSCKSDSKQESY